MHVNETGRGPNMELFLESTYHWEPRPCCVKTPTQGACQQHPSDAAVHALL